MMKAIRDSNLYIALNGNSNTFDERTKDLIELIFKDVFENSAKKVSDIKIGVESEIVYEIPTPIIKDNSMIKEFFENLEVLLEELKEFKPHFTQFERGDRQ